MDEQESMKINEQEDIMTSSVENVQEEDVLVEENVTPFFMNSGNPINNPRKANRLLS